MDPEGEMHHQPDGEKAAVQEEEGMGRLKKRRKGMDVDAGVPQAESAENGKKSEKEGDTWRI